MREKDIVEASTTKKSKQSIRLRTTTAGRQLGTAVALKIRNQDIKPVFLDLKNEKNVQRYHYQ